MGAIDRITCKCTITLNPRRVILEKTQGIWKGCCDACFPWNKIWKSGAVGRITCKVTITLNPRRVILEKTRNLMWLGRHAFSLENTRNCRGWRERHRNLQFYKRIFIYAKLRKSYVTNINLYRYIYIYI